ncbi:MAG: DUF2505 family protein [Actinomycetota bacterium]|nr:DUF2505 family protein [Actinomycetota bacterium]
MAGDTRFHAEHRFHATAQAVAGRLADPAFHLALVLPDLAEPELIAQHTDGDEVTLRLRYEYVGQLDKTARRLLGGRRLTWVQEITVDQGFASGSLTMEAEANPRLLHGRADFRIVPDPEGARRSLDGTLTVAVPGLGSMAERRIVPGVLHRLDVEAATLDECLGGAPQDPGAGGSNGRL